MSNTNFIVTKNQTYYGGKNKYRVYNNKTGELTQSYKKE